MELRNKNKVSYDNEAFANIGDKEDRLTEYQSSLAFQSQDLVIPKEKHVNNDAKKIQAEGGGAHGISVKHPTTYLDTLMHIFRGNIGSGIYAMGDAFKNSGIAMAPWLIVVLGVICVHSQHILLNASDKLKKELDLDVNPDFAETVEICFATGPRRARKYAPLMKTLVNIFLCITQLGICCVYFVFVSKNVKQVCDIYGYVLDVHAHMAIILIPILLSCMVRNLKYLAPLSTIANLIMFVGIVITLYYATQDLPPLSSSTAVADFRQFPLFFGTAIYAFEGIALVLPLRREMKKPSLFGSTFGVLNIGMTIVGLMFIIMGFISYLKYGDDIQGSITLNLPQEEILAQCVKIMISTGILMSFALQFYIPINIMFTGVNQRFGAFKHPVIAELAFRSVFVLIIFALAESIPFLELFISLVGSLSSTIIGLVFPPIIEFVTYWGVAKMSPWMVGKNVGILGLGLLGAATGTYASLEMIVKAFAQGRS